MKGSSSKILYRLFRVFPDDSYVILTNSALMNSEFLNQDFKLPCRYYYAKGIFPGNPRGIKILMIEWLLVPLALIKCLYVVRKEKVNKILVNPIMGNYLLSAYIVHKITRVPLYLYMFDLFAENNMRYLQRILVRPLERIAMHAASKVFVMSEAMQDHYFNKYKIRTTLLPHPIDLNGLGRHTESDVRNERKYKLVLTAGMIYEAQIDAIVNLVKAIKEVPEIVFHIYTLNTEEYIRKCGISGDNVVYHGHVDLEHIIFTIQREADVLFLPMAFNCPNPELIKTASPVKLPEYLGSGVPILVHAPPYAYVSWYARKHGWGMVVDEPKPEQIRNALLKLINDEKLQQTLVDNARKTALLHDVNRVFKIFKNGMGIPL